MVKIVICHEVLLRLTKQTTLIVMFKNDLLLFIFYKSENLFKRLNYFQALSRKTIFIINYYTHTKEKPLSVHMVFLDKKKIVFI